MSHYVQRERKNFTPADAAAGRSAYQYVTTKAPQIVDGDLVVEWGAQGKAAPFNAETVVVDGVEVLGAFDIAAMLGASVTMFSAPVPIIEASPKRTEDEARRERVAARQAEKARLFAEAEEKEAKRVERERRAAIHTALAANDEPAALALMTDEERAAHEERKRVAAQKPQESKP